MAKCPTKRQAGRIYSAGCTWRRLDSHGSRGSRHVAACSCEEGCREFSNLYSHKAAVLCRSKWRGGIHLRSPKHSVAGCSCVWPGDRSLVRLTFSLGPSLVCFSDGLLTTCHDVVTVRDVSDLQDTPIAVINTSRMDVLPVMDIISASVPRLFTQEYAEMILSGSLPPSQWPILAVIRMSDLDNSTLDQDHDQCGLYVMREKAIELVHKYRGTR